ncbi:hypothetical protein C8R44DRAFT_754676 [Mycena epipterygia]|nr:hypothetical protein C8R44DRAFT_754676 [Mycena epipterygia]
MAGSAKKNDRSHEAGKSGLNRFHETWHQSAPFSYPLPNPPPYFIEKERISDATKYYYRHNTDGSFGADGVTWVPSQTAPTAPPSPNSGAAQGPAPASPSNHHNAAPTTERSRRTSPSRRSRSRSPRRCQPSRSPPRYREYEHEYGMQNRGYGYHSGPQHYRPSRTCSRSPEQGPSRWGHRDDRRGGTGNSRYVSASYHSPRRSPPQRHSSQVPRDNNATASATTPTTTSTVLAPANIVTTKSMPAKVVAHVAAPAARVTVVPPPNLDTASRNKRGHPQFPIDSNESEYVGADESDTVAKRIARYEKGERTHVKRLAIAKAAKAAKSPSSPRHYTPLWAKIDIDQLSDVLNLLRWQDAGEPHARKLVLHLEQEYGVGSKLARNEGIAHIMGQQAHSSAAYRLATTGLIKAPKRARNTSPFDDEELTISDDPDADKDTEMPPFIASYLGSSPPGGDDHEIPNSYDPAHEAATFFEALDTVDWPKAMRDDTGKYPTSKHARPHLNDVRCHLTVEHLSPELDGHTPALLAHAQYVEQSMLMFSAAGMYARHVEIGKLRFDEIPIHDHYISGTHVDFTHVAAWFFSHGLAAHSSDTLAMESFARSFRNRVQGNLDPENTSFAAWPHDASCTAMVPAADIIKNAAAVLYESGPLVVGEDTIMGNDDAPTS